MKGTLKISDKIVYGGLTVSLILMILFPPIGTITMSIFGGVILLIAIFEK